ncbi:unnamed protein product [Ixodes persulcatus]
MRKLLGACFVQNCSQREQRGGSRMRSSFDKAISARLLSVHLSSILRECWNALVSKGGFNLA